MKKIIVLVSAISLIGLLSNCHSSSDKDKAQPEGGNEHKDIQAFRLLDNSCFFCHSPGDERPNAPAPAIAEIRKHYITSAVSEEQFTKDLIRYLSGPADSLSKIPGAVKKYGLMPKMSHTPEQLATISHYLYQYPVGEKDWFTQVYPLMKEKLQSPGKQASPLETGQEMAMKTKAVLGMYLLSAIKDRGTEGAVEFCSTRALQITDSMSQVLGIRIKRVSDQNRNPVNIPENEALSYIQKMKAAIAEKESPKPGFSETTEVYTGYYPILTDKLCIQCHGEKNTDIKAPTLSIINRLYPEDKATGFKLNDLRGIWVVEMKKKK